MKKFSALPKKSMAVISLILTLALMLGSVVAVPASAEETATVTTGTWAPMKNFADSTGATLPTSVNSDFTWGFTTNAGYKAFTDDYTAPTVSIITGGLSAQWTAYEGAASYVLNFIEVDYGTLTKVATTELTAATTDLEFGKSYYVQVDALDANGAVIATSIPRTYDYVNYALATGDETTYATVETYPKDTDPTVRTLESIDIAAAPGGKAFTTTNAVAGNENISYYYKNNAITLDTMPEAIAVWVGQTGFEYNGETYYQDRSLFTHLNNKEIDGASTDTNGTAGVYHRIIPTDGGRLGTVGQRNSQLSSAIITSGQYIDYTYGAYYVIDLSRYTEENWASLKKALTDNNRFELNVHMSTGSQYRYYNDEGVTTRPDSATKSEEGFLAARDTNKYYFSNLMFISDLSTFLDNNGISPTAVAAYSFPDSLRNIYAEAGIQEIEAPAARISTVSTVADVDNITTVSNTKRINFKPTLETENLYYTYAVETANNAGGKRIYATFDETAGMNFGFTAPYTGEYHVSTRLARESGETEVSYRAYVENTDGQVAPVTDVMTIAADAATSDVFTYGNLNVDLNAGDKLWLRAWSDGATTLSLYNPLYTMVEVTETVDTETTVYPALDFVPTASQGTTLNGVSYLAVPVDLGSKANYLWDVGGFGFKQTAGADTADDTTDDVYAETTSVVFNRLKSDGCFDYNGTVDGIQYNGKLIMRTAAGTTTFPQKVAISYTFTMPKDGDLTLTQMFAGKRSWYYRVTVVSGDTLTIITADETYTDGWIPENPTGSNDYNDPYTVTGLKTGDKVSFEAYQTGGAYAFKSAPIATVVTEKSWVYGDSNNDGTFDLVDLVQLKKAAAEIGEVVRMKAVNIDGDEASYATDLTVMRRALIKAETYEAYLERITAEAGTSTPEVA